MATQEFPALENDLFLRAARGEKTERVPIWIMRQAGRYLPEFKKVRAEADFFRVCRTPELAMEVTMQPLRRYPLDAAIIFSDILVIPQAMGVEVQMVPGKGPVLPNPLATPDDLERVTMEPDVQKELQYVFDALSLTRTNLKGKVPLIGFSGAPWTLMAYMIEGEGSKTWEKGQTWLYKYPEASHRLLEAMSKVIVQYLIGQVKAGAQALQVFDSWAGCLAPNNFHEFAFPYLKMIGDQVKAACPDVPLICFAKGANHAMKKLAAETKYDVLALDWTCDRETIRETVNVGRNVTVQGNLDPAVLFAPPAVIRSEVERMLKQLGTQKLIANLGDGLRPNMDPEHVGAFIKSVQEVSLEMNALE